MKKEQSILDFKEEVIIDDHTILKGERIIDYLMEFELEVYFNEISNMHNVYYILDEYGNELEDFEKKMNKDTKIRLCKEVVNYSYDDVYRTCPDISYEDYKNEVIKEFLYDENISRSFSKNDDFFILYYCNEWNSHNSRSNVGVYTESVLRNKIIKEIKLNTIDWNSHEDPLYVSLDTLRDTLVYMSFEQVNINY